MYRKHIENPYLTIGVAPSQAEPKGIGIITAIQKIDPLSGYEEQYSGNRRFIIVRDIQDPHKKKSKKGSWVDILLVDEQQSGEDVLPSRTFADAQVLYHGINNAQKIFDIVSEQTVGRIAPDVLLFLKDSESYVRPQPLFANIWHRLRRIRRDEGFQGAMGRIQHVIDHHFDNTFRLIMQGNDGQTEFAYPVDFVSAQENIILASDVYPLSLTPRRKQDQDKPLSRKRKKKAFLDTGCVVTVTPPIPESENQRGYVGLATSAGVVFEANANDQDFGRTFFDMSAKTGFEKPSGHFYAQHVQEEGNAQRVNPQDPQRSATGGNYPRADLLGVAEANSMINSPYLQWRRAQRVRYYNELL